MNTFNTLSRSISLGRKAHSYAKALASRQIALGKQKQIYLNTLAVFVVSCYLEAIGIETNLQQGDRDNPCMQALLDLTVLDLPGYGKLECCAVLPGETVIDITLKPEHDDLIGYVAVEFDGDLDYVGQLSQARLVGFIPAVQKQDVDAIITWEPNQIPLSARKPLPTLLDYILDSTHRESPSDTQGQGEIPISNISPQPANITKISDWSNGEYKHGWRSNSLIRGAHLQTASLEVAGCSNTTDAYLEARKVIDLRKETVAKVVLSIFVKSQCDEQFEVSAKVEPFIDTTGYETYLPIGLELSFIFQNGHVHDRKRISSKEAFIYLIENFENQRDESFSIQVSIDGFTVTETFFY
ncbi:MAG: DUF1822 family protein [Cyanobacteria bacterium CRU_2_1]|nr:DUF1822 family protein [Cyanobacteria bacterium CRU_2_1]